MKRLVFVLGRSLFVGLATVAVISPYIGRTGTFHEEAMGFFAHYTRTDLSFPAKIFNPKFTENGMYQARELSYVVDFVDAHVIAFLIRHRWYYFFPLSHLAAVLGSLV